MTKLIRPLEQKKSTVLCLIFVNVVTGYSSSAHTHGIGSVRRNKSDFIGNMPRTERLYCVPGVWCRANTVPRRTGSSLHGVPVLVWSRFYSTMFSFLRKHTVNVHELQIIVPVNVLKFQLLDLNTWMRMRKTGFIFLCIVGCHMAMVNIVSHMSIFCRNI